MIQLAWMQRRAWQPTPVFLPGESPGTEEPGGLRSTGSQRVGDHWATKPNTTKKKKKFTAQEVFMCSSYFPGFLQSGRVCGLWSMVYKSTWQYATPSPSPAMAIKEIIPKGAAIRWWHLNYSGCWVTTRSRAVPQAPCDVQCEWEINLIVALSQFKDYVLCHHRKFYWLIKS